MSKPEFVYVIYIQSTPEKIWQALIDPEMTKEFWGRHKNVSDWKPGSEWRHQNYDDAGDVPGGWNRGRKRAAPPPGADLGPAW
jgi:uncharacterized protein YndB with AHSA1/START domain